MVTLAVHDQQENFMANFLISHLLNLQFSMQCHFTHRGTSRLHSRPTAIVAVIQPRPGSRLPWRPCGRKIRRTEYL